MNLSAIGDAQLLLLKRAKSYLNLAESNGLNVESSALCYFNSWSPCLGNAILKYWCFGVTAIGNLLIQYVRSIALIGAQSNYQLSIKPKVDIKFSTIIVSWSKKSDFLADGSYHDRYLQVNSKDMPSALWILIPIDGACPSKLNANIGIIERDSLARKYDYLFLIKTIYRKVIQSKGNWKILISMLSATTVFSEQVAELICDEARDININYLLMPYEAQPFQNETFSCIKKVNTAIRTIGYLHSSLAAFPVDLLFRRGAPDTLWVHGDGQKEILCGKLGWPLSRVKKIKSLRYKLEGQPYFGGHIFLPYSFSDPTRLVDSFKDLLSSYKESTLPDLIIRNHPLMAKSRQHILLSAKIQSTIQRFHKEAKKNGDKFVSIFIGVTAGMIEALERDIKVIQICSNSIFEAHSERIWSSLSVKQLGKNIFSYKLKKRGVYIEFGDENHVLKTHLHNEGIMHSEDLNLLKSNKY